MFYKYLGVGGSVDRLGLVTITYVITTVLFTSLFAKNANHNAVGFFIMGRILQKGVVIT